MPKKNELKLNAALPIAAKRAQALFTELIGADILDQEMLEETAPETWNEITAAGKDLEQTDVAALKAAVVRAYNLLDELVGAGILDQDVIQTMSPETWDEIAGTMNDLRAAGL